MHPEDDDLESRYKRVSLHRSAVGHRRRGLDFEAMARHSRDRVVAIGLYDAAKDELALAKAESQEEGRTRRIRFFRN